MIARYAGLISLGLGCIVANPVLARTLHVAQKPLVGIVADAQFARISDAAAVAGPGDTVFIHSGVYREKVIISKSGSKSSPIRFESAPGAHVIVTGADRITGWKPEPGDDRVYSVDWPHSFIDWGREHTHAAPPPIGRAEQVFALGYQLRQTMSRETMPPGSFYVDDSAHRLYVRLEDNSSGYTPASIDSTPIDAATREMVWECKGAWVVTKGIRFRYSANHAQLGAATFSGAHDTVEDCVFERMNGEGADFNAEGIVVRRCVFQDNGLAGFCALKAHGLLISDCLIRNNNTKNFDRGWSGGGLKIVLTRGAVLERSRFLENRGVGIWFDIGNERSVIRNCLIADNESAGIFYEISYSLHAHDNVIVGNGFGDTPGAWGATAGISLSSSPNCLVERNLILGNAEGFSLREQLRTTPRIGGDLAHEVAVWNHDQRVRANIFAANGIGIAGWFAAGDGRHWPRSRSTGGAGSAKVDDFAGAYVAKDPAGQPTGLSLESLKLSIEDNVFCGGPEQTPILWGPTWEEHREYARIEDARKELGIGFGVMTEAMPFADASARDYRVPAGSPIARPECYPKGTTPGVALGIIQATGQPAKR